MISTGIMEDDFWTRALDNQAGHFGASGGVELVRVLIDPQLQGAQAGNLWNTAGIRNTFYTLLAPIRRVRRLVKR